jgi:hypothetical protein
LSELFFKKKDKSKYKIVELIKKLKNEYIHMKVLRLDDAGENHALEKKCKQQNLGIKFEYSGPCTPERNRKIEQKCQTLYIQIRAIIN